MSQPSERRDLRNYPRILWRWKFVFLAILVIAPVVTYTIEVNKPKQYRTSTLLLIRGNTLDPALFGQTSAIEDLPTIEALVTTRPVAIAAAKLLQPPPANPASLAGQVVASADPQTKLMTITATDGDPRRAAQIANAFGTTVADNQSRATIAQADPPIADVRAQLRKLPARDKAARGVLTERLRQMLVARAAQSQNSQVIEQALPSFTPLGRSPRRAIALGLVIGLLLGCALVAVAESSDRRVRTVDDVEALSGSPLLSAVPSTAFASRGRGDARDDEPFKRLRDALKYFNVDRKLSSVLITSPAQQDGKTTVAVRLAMAMARAGTDTILLEGDLRRPQIAQRLGLDEQADGLTSVLARERSIDEVLVDYALTDDVHGGPTDGGRLRVLPAGSVPLNPSEMIGSQAMKGVLTELESRADLVIIDTPALLVISDALSLVPRVSGVLLAARLGRTSRVGVKRLRQLVLSANGVLLGATATGAPAREGYEGHGYRYYEHGGPSWRQRRRARRSVRERPAEPDPPSVPDPATATPGAAGSP